MRNDSERTFQWGQRWYLLILGAALIVSYLRFFPIGQRPWMFPVSAAVESVWVIATAVYLVLCLRAIKARKQHRD